MKEGISISRKQIPFLGYRIYRRKFLITTLVVLLISFVAFSGVLGFFINSWMTDLRQQSQTRFWEREQQLAGIRNWTYDYTNRLYESTSTMDDLKALLASADERQYLAERRQNSLESPFRISYLPANVKNLFLDKRSRITGVTLRSESGMKTLWMDRGDIRLSFEFDEWEETRSIAWFGDMMVVSYSLRDPEYMSRSIGTIEFWVNSSDLYGKDAGMSAAWGVLDEQGRMLTDSGLDRQQMEWLVSAAKEERQTGWMSAARGKSLFYAKFESTQADYTYVVAMDVLSAMKNNSYMVLALIMALIMIDLSVLVSSYINLQSDADFLTMILMMLNDMEKGDFDKLAAWRLPVRHRKNEYGMIADALQDVGLELKGYIEREYVLKLKEQETQMRALQHQINPHFLYNTLETLRSKALMQGDRDMADAIAMLGTLYRSRMHKKEAILLKEEFELLEMYLKIMTLRFGDKFVYQVQLGKEIENMETVSFWLQPLAENFFTHGFDRESEYNLLIVSGQVWGDGAKIEIMDNGFGADKDRLEEIRRNMYEGNDDPEADIGLRNVYMRLRYFYGSGFEMKIGNNAEGGFCISIYIPGKVGEYVHIDDRG